MLSGCKTEGEHRHNILDMQTISIIDSHTGGEPTRLVTSGGPELGSGPLSERLALLRREHDNFRSAVVCEPRGSDVLVGALLFRQPPLTYLAFVGVIACTAV